MFSRRHCLKDLLVLNSFSFYVCSFYLLHKLDQNKKRLFETISYEEALELENKDYEDEFIKIRFPKYDPKDVDLLNKFIRVKKNGPGNSTFNALSAKSRALGARLIFVGGYARSGKVSRELL